MFRKILVAFDGSPQSRHALSAAILLAKSLGAELHALVVVRPPEFPELQGEVQAAMKEAGGPIAEALAWARQQAAAAGLTLHSARLLGHPAETVLRYAEEHAFDLVVLGRRGRSAPARWMLGSVSERVLRYAHCPVMVVH